MSAISVRLGLLRVEQGLSQQQLAEATGLRRDTISALERGKSQGIEFGTLARLCDALGVLPNDILEVGPQAHIVPVLGGEDEDEIIAERLAEVDLDELIANPALALIGLIADDAPLVAPAAAGSEALAAALRGATNEDDPAPGDLLAALGVIGAGLTPQRQDNGTIALHDRAGNLVSLIYPRSRESARVPELDRPQVAVAGRP